VGGGHVSKGRPVLAAFLISLGVVFLAELGDKSQLITLTYALRYRWWVVLTGVGIAAFLVHGISVAIGHFLGLSLPDKPIAFAAAIAFLGFAAWTWREMVKNDSADDDVKTVPQPRYVVLAVVSSFVLAELGDKTMLATVALASDNNWAGVWLGATVGMVLADGAAIAAAQLLHRQLPERLLHGMAALLFLVFGLWMLFDGALGWRLVAIITTSTVVGAVAVVAITRRILCNRPAPGTGAPIPEPDPVPGD
jgi:Ca2+/H+ antiporter, TMEM165/GDT1 family